MTKLMDWHDYAGMLKEPSPLIDDSELMEAGEALEEACSFAALVEMITRPGFESTKPVRAIVLSALGFPEDWDEQHNG